MKFAASLFALAQAAEQDKVRIEVVASSFCCHCGLNWKAFRTAVMSQPDLDAIMDVQLNFLFPLPAGEHQQSAASYAQSYTTNSDYLADGASMCAIKHSKMWPLLTDCIFAKNWDGDFVEPYTTNFWARDEAVFDAELMKCAEALTDYPLQEFRDCVYGKPLEDLGPYTQSESDKLRIENVNKEHDVWKRMGGKPVATGGITWALVNDVYITDHSVEQPKAPNWENDAVVGRAPWLAKLIPAICNAWGGDSSTIASCNNVDAIVQKYVEELGDFNPCGVQGSNATIV